MSQCGERYPYTKGSTGPEPVKVMKAPVHKRSRGHDYACTDFCPIDLPGPRASSSTVLEVRR